MAQYNGYPSWNSWNVSLWINNDEGLYNFCRDVVQRNGYGDGAKFIAVVWKGFKTPDGAPYSLRSIRLAIRGIID